jgi:serine carboxypeptidase-like clade 2
MYIYFLNILQIGNAVINDDTDSPGMYDFLASHAIISDKAAYDINKNICDFSSSNNLTDECNAVADEVSMDLAFIDLYNIYAPVCKNGNITSKPKKYTVSLKFQYFSSYLLLNIYSL